MQVFIPTIGTMFVLTKDWTFTLHEESRNYTFSKVFRCGFEEWPNWRNEAKTKEITLPAGTVLKVDRIYIRKGGKDMKEFDSVTFWCNTHVKPAQAKKDKLKRGRFWAKLPEVNQMHVDFYEEE